MPGAAAAIRCRQIAIWINFIYRFLRLSVSIESSRVEKSLDSNEYALMRID